MMWREKNAVDFKIFSKTFSNASVAHQQEKQEHIHFFSSGQKYIDNSEKE